MKLAFRLAYKNLVGAGLRTWLTVIVLSIAFIAILFINGLVNGWNQEGKKDMINWQIGQGELQYGKYDPYDPFTIESGHGILPEADRKDMVPVLVRQASIYPQHRMMSVIIKGIDENQTLLKLPTNLLKESQAEMPTIIGTRMAASTALKVGDQVLLRWRDKNGSFDAVNITIVGIFNTHVPSVDIGQIWIPIKKLWSMTELTGEVTLWIAGPESKIEPVEGWIFRDKDYLLTDFNKLLKSERISDAAIYLFLLAIALLAIFDTQVLSVFRRQREIGTYIALGMTRMEVVGLFTFEGGMNSILAMIVGCIYGLPLLIYCGYIGIPMPGAVTKGMGIVMADKLYPVYGAGLILGTIALVVISSTIVSFLPSRKISNMNPVDALKGKIQ